MAKDMDEIIKALKNIVPEENFRKQPDFSISFLVDMENKYQLNTSDFLSKNYDIPISEEDVFDWLNEFENLLLFNGDETKINTI